jgi:endonuclease III
MARLYRTTKTRGTVGGRGPSARGKRVRVRAQPVGGEPRAPNLPGAGGSPRSQPSFHIDEAFRRLRVAVADLPKAAMFDLRDRGYDTPFEQLVGALISARTRDETTVKVCLRLFQVASTPQQMLELDEGELTRLLFGSSFPEAKARDILAMCSRIVNEWGGRVPDRLEELTTLRGVGPKIAALTLAVGFGRPAIAVDIHVHRIVNRWGYVAASTPEKTMLALTNVLPERYWIEINERLVPFGKSICTGVRPRCSACPLLSMCRQVGVTEHR